MATKCAICDKYISAKAHSLECASCNKSFHLECTALNEIDFLTINKSEHKWRCIMCISQSGSYASTIENMLSAQLEILTVEINKKMNDITLSIKEDFCNKMDALINSFNIASSKIDEIDNRLVKLEENQKSNATDQCNLEDFMREYNDRQNRKSNVLIFNVKESNAIESNKQAEDDSRLIRDIIQERELDIVPLRITRLGRRQSNKARPIKIILNNELDAKRLLRSNSLVDDNNIRFHVDRTPKQMDFFNKLKQELEERRNRGENVFIRYVNDVPCITTARPSPRSKN